VERKLNVKVLYIIAAILILFWFAGLIFKFIISPLIHLALVVGLGLLAWNFIQGSINRRAV
jgi:ABC-type polysaccharide/polyol phosphate export permease